MKRLFEILDDYWPEMVFGSFMLLAIVSITVIGCVSAYAQCPGGQCFQPGTLTTTPPVIVYRQRAPIVRAAGATLRAAAWPFRPTFHVYPAVPYKPAGQWQYQPYGNQ